MKILINGIQSNLRFSSAHVIPAMNPADLFMVIHILLILKLKVKGQENLSL